MKKNEKEISLTSKEKKKIKEQIYDEIKDDLTVEISKSIIDEVKKSLNDSYKDDLKTKISDEISDDIKKTIKKEETKVYRSKDLKIFRLYIYIILLIGLFGFVIYKLYVTNHLNVIVPDNIKIPSITVPETTASTTSKSEDLIKKYEYLMNNIKVKDSTLLNGQFKVTDMAEEEKLKLAYNTLKKDKVSIEGAIYMISSSDLKDAYSNIFNSDDFTNKDFKVDNLDYKYSSKTDSYIAISSGTTSSDEYILEIENVFEDDTYVYIEVITALKKNDYIYNINNIDSSITKYKSGVKLSKYKNNLTMNRIVFEKESNKLYAILKI